MWNYPSHNIGAQERLVSFHFYSKTNFFLFFLYYHLFFHVLVPCFTLPCSIKQLNTQSSRNFGRKIQRSRSASMGQTSCDTWVPRSASRHAMYRRTSVLLNELLPSVGGAAHVLSAHTDAPLSRTSPFLSRCLLLGIRQQGIINN